jgi:RimJ/RimL family protein N-acetyltransferase
MVVIRVGLQKAGRSISALCATDRTGSFMGAAPNQVVATQVGPPVEPLPSGRAPGRAPLQGRYVRLEPVDVPAHAPSLYALSHARPEDAALWTYLAYGPFADQGAFEVWLGERARSEDPLFFAIIAQASGQASGMASYLNIVPDMGCIEIGHIWFAPPLQKTRAATEGIFLMMRHVFDDLGYRRLEWKCNALNAASIRAASASPTKARSASTWWSRDAIATPPGSPCSIATGRPCVRRSSAGSRPTISTLPESNGSRLRRSPGKRDRYGGTPQCTVTLSVR